MVSQSSEQYDAPATELYVLDFRQKAHATLIRCNVSSSYIDVPHNSLVFSILAYSPRLSRSNIQALLRSASHYDPSTRSQHVVNHPTSYISGFIPDGSGKRHAQGYPGL